MSRNKTVAIIGAGMAGLAAARLLCSRGVAVRLFEANDKVGGCCATTRLAGYTFNDGAIYLAMPGMLDYLFRTLGLERRQVLPLRRISQIQAVRLPDASVVTLGAGGRIAIEGAAGASAGARAQAELDDFLRKWEPALRFFADDIMVRPLSLAHLLGAGWRHLAALRGTVAAHLRGSFSSEAARAALAGALLYTGAPPDRMPAALLLGLVAMLRDGCFLPEGGMGRIPEVLGDAVRQQGGSIALHAGVRRIVVRGARACAVEVENEGVIEFDALISAVSAMHTYGSLLRASDVPAGVARKLRRSTLSHQGFVLQLGLSNQISVRSHSNCVLPWLGEQSQVFQPKQDDLHWPIYTVPTLTLPELAPSGGSIVEMFPAIRQDIAPANWSEARKDEVTAQAIRRLRRDHEIDIAVCRVLSPREFQDQTHLHGAALYGLSPLASPAALFQHRSPIRGLYLAGQTTWPGFGVVGAGISGVLAAQALMADEAR